jgi:cytochrome c oxidase cbb3-type subunit 3
MAQANDRDRILDHEYDGIQEYDNPMPRWWVNIFWATIVFAVLYAIGIGPIGTGAGRIARYEAAVAAAKAREPKGGGAMDAGQLAALAADPTTLALGEATYAKNCASCHRPDGGGLIGPNLTDHHWLHGGSLIEVYRTVNEGVLARGMPAWGKMLKPDEIAAVTAYVASLRGSNPADARPPQGELVTGAP